MKNLLLLLLLVSACSRKQYHREYELPEDLEAAIDSDSRFEENVERDEYVHPGDTLQFFGIKPEMTVVEINPGSGYYTEILAPFLAKSGQYYIAYPYVPRNAPQFLKDNEKKLQEILMRNREVQTKTKFIPFGEGPKKVVPKLAYADMVLSFAHVHNWVAAGTLDQSFKFFYDILKPGGILGITQHRVPKGKTMSSRTGYLSETFVAEAAKRAGFKLAAKSEINANPKDKADYKNGVWTLPPYYRLGEKDKKKYEEIGESDKMTLKFIKP